MALADRRCRTWAALRRRACCGIGTEPGPAALFVESHDDTLIARADCCAQAARVHCHCLGLRRAFGPGGLRWELALLHFGHPVLAHTPGGERGAARRSTYMRAAAPVRVRC